MESSEEDHDGVIQIIIPQISKRGWRAPVGMIFNCGKSSCRGKGAGGQCTRMQCTKLGAGSV